MRDVIVFISPDIEYMMRDKIAHVLSLNHIEITYDINCANLVIQKEDIEESIQKIFEKLNSKPYELVAYPIEMPIISTKKIKHYVQKSIDIKRFNKIKQSNNKIMYNATRRR
ncbi:MAG: hypothetical protein IKZ49_04795 [Alphaproteobacteria bacterium]|nr:hypothetical protein [Alphaproteobacteria bacterium]